MNNTPKLRFKEFSGDWKCKVLDDLSEKIMVGIASSTTHAYRKSGIIMFRNQNIKANKLDDLDILYLDEEYEKTHKNKRLMPGDLLTARTGYPGTTCVVPSKYINTQTFTTLITRPNKNLAISNYLSQYINSDRGTKFFKSVEIGGGQKNVNAETLKSLPIFIPCLNEQEKIASFFSLIDDKISLQGEKVEALKDYKKGMMQKIFSRELRFKDDDGIDYPGWEEKKLDDLCNIKKGDQLNKDSLIPDGEYYALNGGIDPSGYTDKYNTESETISISEGGNSCGYVNYNFERFWSGGHCYTLEYTSECIDNKYLYQFLKYNQLKIMSLRVGSGLPNIQKKDLTILKVDIPCIEEQLKISSLLFDIDTKIKLEKEKLESLNEYKKGLLQQMFV